jgi:hypothetical protein
MGGSGTVADARGRRPVTIRRVRGGSYPYQKRKCIEVGIGKVPLEEKERSVDQNTTALRSNSVAVG